jgi:hypothetical protein
VCCMQTCVSVISSFAIGNAFTCSKLYASCKIPCGQKKNQTVVRGEAVEAGGAEGGGGAAHFVGIIEVKQRASVLGAPL